MKGKIIQIAIANETGRLRPALWSLTDQGVIYFMPLSEGVWHEQELPQTDAKIQKLNDKSLTFTREELEVLQSALEVIVDGAGTYTMLRLPHLVKVHEGLLDKFSAAIGRKRG